MRVGDEPVIGPAHHQVTNIDHEGIGRRGDVDPFALAGVDLQTAGPVFVKQQGELVIVGMRPAAASHVR